MATKREIMDAGHYPVEVVKYEIKTWEGKVSYVNYTMRVLDGPQKGREFADGISFHTDRGRSILIRKLMEIGYARPNNNQSIPQIVEQSWPILHGRRMMVEVKRRESNTGSTYAYVMWYPKAPLEANEEAPCRSTLSIIDPELERIRAELNLG